jgi:hypothetical protein
MTNIITAINFSAHLPASATSSASDFDFLQGKWTVKNRKLKERLCGSQHWLEFDSCLHMQKALNGKGNIENYYTTFDGQSFEGMAIRLYDANTRLWKIYWIDSSGPVMDQHPVTGSFEDGVGKFYAADECKGKAIIVLYQWDASDPNHPVWSQAFSPDNGSTWEWNWEMILTREV